MVSATNTILVSGMLLLGSSMSALPQEDVTKTLYFDGGVCLIIDLTAPEIVDVRTARRFSLNAPRGFFLEATSFDFSLPSVQSVTTVRLQSVFTNQGESAPPDNFGQCAFTEGISGFQTQIDGDGVCSTGVHNVTYHSEPGSSENITVRCTTSRDSFCGMSFLAKVDQAEARISVSTLENPPHEWVSIADGVRSFFTAHVSFSPEC